MAASPKSPPPLLPTRLLIPWAALLCVVLLVQIGLGEEPTSYATPFAIAHSYRMLVGAELFFILVLAPLLQTPQSAIFLLLALASPAVVVAAWVSDSTLPQVAASQAYLVAAALLVAAFLRFLAARRDCRLTSDIRNPKSEVENLGWYWLVVGALGAGAPFVAFVAEDLLRARVRWLYALSPFWVADRFCHAETLGWDLALPSAALLLVAIAFLLCSARPRTNGPVAGAA